MYTSEYTHRKVQEEQQSPQVEKWPLFYFFVLFCFLQFLHQICFNMVRSDSVFEKQNNKDSETEP